MNTILMNRLDGDAVGPAKVLVSSPVYPRPCWPSPPEPPCAPWFHLGVVIEVYAREEMPERPKSRQHYASRKYRTL